MAYRTITRESCGVSGFSTWEANIDELGIDKTADPAAIMKAAYVLILSRAKAIGRSIGSAVDAGGILRRCHNVTIFGVRFQSMTLESQHSKKTLHQPELACLRYTIAAGIPNFAIRRQATDLTPLHTSTRVRIARSEQGAAESGRRGLATHLSA